MAENEYANAPNMSRSEEIIQSILDNTEYDEAARSRIEYLLIELKNAIAAGGGGGSVTSYAPLTEKPKIDNHTLQAGNNSSSDLGLQTKLTFDSAPTENSTNPVTSGGVYTALGNKANSADVYNKYAVDTALSAKADKSTTYAKSEVDAALSTKQNTISDLSAIRSGAAAGATAVQPAALETALAQKQDALSSEQLDAVNSGITSTDVAQITTNKNNILFNTNNGVKNLCKPNVSADSEVTYTVNADNSITITCNTTALREVHIFTDLSGLTDGKDYILSGCNGGNYSSTYGFAVRTSGGTCKAFESDGETTFTKTAEIVKMDLIIRSGQNWTKTFYPMIRPASISDPTYQPYAMSNAELTAKEQQNESDILTGLTLVAHTSANGNTSLSYDTNVNDFNIGGANSDKSSGSYLVICTNWSETPAPYIGLISFSGGNTAKFIKTDVVTGFTPTITITQNAANATIAISGAAKISIYATK